MSIMGCREAILRSSMLWRVLVAPAAVAAAAGRWLEYGEGGGWRCVDEQNFVS